MQIGGFGLAPRVLGCAELGNGKAAVVIRCNCCERPKKVEVVLDDLQRWDSGRGQKVQDCFPYLAPAERELFISGLCGPCFDVMSS